MANHQLLNNIAHQAVRVHTQYAAEFGDDIGAVTIFPNEIVKAQRDYPILFKKAGDGQFHCIALMGFEPEENLHLTNNTWSDAYVPAVLSKGPFLIGFQQQIIDGMETQSTVIHIDMDHPRISRTQEGVSIFKEHGGHSDYLQEVIGILEMLDQGVQLAKKFSDMLEKTNLLQSVDLDIQINAAVNYKLTGYYAINNESFNALAPSVVLDLYQSGLLPLIYFVQSSLQNMQRLIELKNRRLLQAESKVSAY